MMKEGDALTEDSAFLKQQMASLLAVGSVLFTHSLASLLVVIQSNSRMQQSFLVCLAGTPGVAGENCCLGKVRTRNINFTIAAVT